MLQNMSPVCVVSEKSYAKISETEMSSSEICYFRNGSASYLAHSYIWIEKRLWSAAYSFCM